MCGDDALSDFPSIIIAPCSDSSVLLHDHTIVSDMWDGQKLGQLKPWQMLCMPGLA